MGKVIISEKEYRRLLGKELSMNYLRSVGVLDWEGVWDECDESQWEKDERYVNDKVKENLIKEQNQ